MKKFIIGVLFLISLNNVCAQNLGPGYQFTLFENTPNWDLAKAVENEDTSDITFLIKSGNYNINLQEPKFGTTLLLLAIGNDKYASTKSLLENGAAVNLKDSYKTSPIFEASKFIMLKKNSLKILNLLVKFGANVNDTFVQLKNNDTISYDVPLSGATANLRCARFLLDNNANPYFNHKNTFIVWEMMLILNFTEGIYVAKYMIIDKKMPIPNPILYSVPDKLPIDIFQLLNKVNFRGDIEKENARKEILDYLHKIYFPKNQVYTN